MTRAAPEAKLQMLVRRYLDVALPADVLWTASMAGTNLSPRARDRAKSMGVKRGFPDLQFVFPDGVTRYIELKAGASLSPEQREFRDHCAAHDIFRVCRSLEEVDAALRGWGARLRAAPLFSHHMGEAA